DVVLVGGGSGAAGVCLFAKQNPNAQVFIGARDAQHLLMPNSKNVHVATDDGSQGYQGTVAELLRQKLKTGKFFINCGPIPMVDAVMPTERLFAPPDKIYSAIEYTTRCGVGVCGSCADKKGLRSCVEGPFVNR
ncbi:MAG: dihydroorotate dehydrogenase, partial [Candidatus Woesearchaeota archaeon]|nr:dihydroorotate dehydrogenase [Candidatus Woesearchaeota archaeon]